VAICALTTLPALAQTGGLTVTVEGADGRPLTDATVVLSNKSGHVKTTALATDEQGLAAFPVLRSGGGYKIEVAHPDYGTLRLVELRVQINQNTRIPVRLSRETQERVEVTASVDVVELNQTQASTRFTDEFIQGLPVANRFYQNILTLAPGVEDADGDGNPTVHGSRSRDFKAVVGGVSNVDPLTGQWMSRVNPNSIEEMEIITAGAGVEFGRAQGGYVRVIQKQGSNEFEGVFDFLWRSSELDKITDHSNVTEPTFDSYQTGFQVSGPIVKDKLWYRLSHEWIEREDPVDTITGTEIVETSSATHADQITWQVSPRNKMAFSFQSDPLEIDNFGVSSVIPPESSQRREWDGDTYSVTWSSPYSAKIFIESQVAWQDLNVGIFPSTTGIPNDCVIGNAALEEAPCLDSSLARTSGSGARTLDDHRQRFTVRSDLTAYVGRFLGASHQIKAGFIVENERYFRSLEQRAKTRLYVIPPFTLEDGMVLEPGTFLAAEIAVPKTAEIRATGISWGLYVEDQLKPMDNMVVTLGLRFDREEISAQGHEPFDPREEQAKFFGLLDQNVPAHTATQNSFTAFEGTVDLVNQLATILGVPDAEILRQLSPLSVESSFWHNTRSVGDIRLINDNPAPYLGLAWDPWANGKTKFAVVASRHYNNIPLGVPLIELEPVITDLTFRVNSKTRFVTRPFSGVNLGLSTKTVDRELKTPYQDELYLSFERELWQETSLKLSYIKREYRDQLQDVDINRFTGDFGACVWATVASPSPIKPLLPQDGVDPELLPGDGIVDDCVGNTEAVPGNDALGQTLFLQRPDGVKDLYVANPGWVDVLLLGNFNSADYDALVLELVRRQFRGWEMQFSYTWSESQGDGEDFLQEFGNDNALLDDERGYQSDDRRHVVKWNATTIIPWGLRLGGALSWRSGLPFSILTEELSFDAVPPPYQNLGAGVPARPRQRYATGARNDQRNDSYWNLDVRLAREFKISRDAQIQLTVEVFNVFNDQTYTIYNPALGLGRQLNGGNEAFLRQGRSWQLGFKVAF
jgi:hypothetical protein